MSDSTTTARPSPQPATRPAAEPTPAPAINEPTLITEQQVLFATAAAAAVPQAQPRRWAASIGSVVAAVRSLVDGSRRPARPVYPARRGYLENALMAREMDRV